MGCYRDKGRRAITQLDGRKSIITGNYRARRYAVEKCAVVAMMKNFKVMGVQHQGWCASSAVAHRTYAKYGRANNCKNGKGGPWANDVYRLKRKFRSVPVLYCISGGMENANEVLWENASLCEYKSAWTETTIVLELLRGCS